MKNCVFALLMICTMFSASLLANPYHPERFEGFGSDFRDNPLDLIAIFLPPNPVIFEAGGHYGTDTARFADKWPQSTILSFEPNPSAFARLLEVSKRYDNIFPFPLALAHFNGTSVFYVCYGTTGDNPIFEGASSLLPASEGMKIHYQGPQILVDCVRLDDWCKSNHVEKIDFMWLDLEGMELQVLRNAPEILKTVSVVFVETNFQEFRIGMTQYTTLKSFMEESGFKMLSHWYAENLQGNAIFIR